MNKKITVPVLKTLKEMIIIMPLKMLFILIINNIHALSFVLSMLSLQFLIDNATKIYNGDNTIIILFPLSVFVIFSIFAEICNGIANFFYEFYPPELVIKLKEKLHLRISEMNLDALERKDILDTINKANEGIEAGIYVTYTVITIFTLYIPYYFFLGLYFKELSPVLLFTILLIFIPTISNAFFRMKIFSKVEDDSALIRRKMIYYENTICDSVTFKETRLLGTFSYFYSKFLDVKSSLNHALLNAEKKSAKRMILTTSLTMIGYISVIYLIWHELRLGKISAGTFAAIFMGIGSMYGLAREIFVGAFNGIAKNAPLLANYWALIDDYKKVYPNNTTSIDDIILSEPIIRLENVSYQYPGQSTNALSSVSLTIQPGDTLAIVGENGAGKTTLVKIIMGLLQPTRGKIFLGSVEINNYNRELYHKKISAVFQNYQKYKLNLNENIIISEYNKNNKQNIEKAILDADLIIDSQTFPNGMETLLSKDFGGIELSGGQWQRIATARGLYRTHDIIILDEPTSSIDPLEETRIYNNFSKLTRDRIGIIVTHRLGAAKIANRIIVLKDGQIHQAGTHNELINNCNYYKNLYEKQAAWYK